MGPVAVTSCSPAYVPYRTQLTCGLCCTQVVRTLYGLLYGWLDNFTAAVAVACVSQSPSSCVSYRAGFRVQTQKPAPLVARLMHSHRTTDLYRPREN